MPDSPTFPAVQMGLVRPKAPVVGRVISNELCLKGKSASFIKHTVIDVSDTPLAGNFRAGQSFGVLAPGVDDAGRPHKVRLYSIACPSWGEDGEAQVLSTTPKRVIDEFVPQSDADDPADHSLFLGVCSNYLCDLKAGDPVALTGPQGKRFLLPHDPDIHNYLFIATGTGIAPFRGMIMELLMRPSGPSGARIDLVMGAPYATDLLYDPLFVELADEYPNFNYHTALSREGDAVYVSDLITRNMDYFCPLLADPCTLIYVCGIEGMERGLFKALVEQDLAEGYLKNHNGTAKPTARCLLEVY